MAVCSPLLILSGHLLETEAVEPGAVPGAVAIDVAAPGTNSQAALDKDAAVEHAPPHSLYHSHSRPPRLPHDTQDLGDPPWVSRR